MGMRSCTDRVMIVGEVFFPGSACGMLCYQDQISSEIKTKKNKKKTEKKKDKSRKSVNFKSYDDLR